MRKITSLFDFFRLADRDNRYRRLAIWCYKTSDWPGSSYTNWNKAKDWIDEWVRINIKYNGIEADCGPMVCYLNDSIKNIIGNTADEIEPIPIVPMPPAPVPTPNSTTTNADPSNIIV